MLARHVTPLGSATHTYDIQLKFFIAFPAFPAELNEIFAESSDVPPALPPKHQTQPAAPHRGATPTLSSIAIPRPPSRRSVEVRRRGLRAA